MREFTTDRLLDILPAFGGTEEEVSEVYREAINNINSMPRIQVGKYTGDGGNNTDRSVGFEPWFVMVGKDDASAPFVIWFSFFGALSKTAQGTRYNDAIKGVTSEKTGFIVGSNDFVNESGEEYSYLAIGR